MAVAAGVVGAAITIASAALSAYQIYQSGQTQGKILKYQSKSEENRATAARQAAEIRAQQDRERTDRLRATARARAAASGVESTEGSPLMVMLENARQAEYQQSLIRYGGEVQSQDFLGQAKIRMFESRATTRAATTQAGTTLLAGVGNAAGAYSRMPSRPTQPTYQQSGDLY